MLKRFKCINPINISLILIGLMFFVPFISMHHEQPITFFYAEWIAGVLGLIAIFPLLLSPYWRATQTTSGEVSLKIPQVSLIFFGLIVILCVQWAMGMLHSNQYAISVLSYFIWGLLLMLTGNYLRREIGLEKLATTLAWGLVVAGIFNIGIVVLQFVMRTGGVIAFLPNLSSYGALAQSNHFADFCALAIASLIYLHAQKKFSLSAFNLMLVLFMVMLSFSGSRSAWLYLSALTILATVMYINAKKQGKEIVTIRSTWHISLLLLPIFTLIQTTIYYIIPNELVSLPTERLLDGITASTVSVRLQFWYDSLRIFLHSPWLGVGAGKFFTNTFLLLDAPTELASKRPFEHAHNLFLHLLAEMGVGAFLIVSIGLFSWVKAFKWRHLTLETWWLVSLLTILSIHSMLEYPLWFTFFLGIAAVLLGAGDESSVTINISTFTEKITRFGLALVCVLGLINVGSLLIANVKLENWLQKLAHEKVNDTAQLSWVRQYSLLSPYGELMQAVTMTVNTKLIDEQVLLNQSAISFKPMKRIVFQQALMLKLQGRDIEAVKQLRRALITFPNGFKSLIENPALKYRQEYLDLFSELQLAAANQDNKK